MSLASAHGEKLVTHDDPDQARRAAGIMQSSQVLIPKSVMLETEWVLRHAYGIDKKNIRRGFQNLMGLPNVKTEDSRSLTLAISWYGLGMDFADALHLASSGEAKELATFDKSLAKKAIQLKAASVILPLLFSPSAYCLLPTSYCFSICVIRVICGETQEC